MKAMGVSAPTPKQSLPRVVLVLVVPFSLSAGDVPLLSRTTLAAKPWVGQVIIEMARCELNTLTRVWWYLVFVVRGATR